MGKEEFINKFSELSLDEKLSIFKRYSEDYDQCVYLYSTNDFDELESDRTPSEIIGDIADDFDIELPFMYYDDSGHLKSISYFGAEDYIYDHIDEIYSSGVWKDFIDEEEE